ncbi:hypothetical protein [Saliphagus infecundisoli]|uniref:Rpa-associated protein n=1 Tax=Saliphagus infecundisoli TaxID=1849069 RepID=A0ABD5QJG7_9EURY|nr:hypothetical protein [Saliphagus infecundisoli]
MSGEDEPVGREVAYRIFAAEYDDATLSHTESDDDRAPNYVITPTGARINRLFVVGTLTEVSRVNEEMVRARVVDPTGAFVVYAGQYQPEALAFLESADPPEFVAVTGKARTFEPDDGDRIYTSVRPESIAVVDADTRDRWVVTTAERTDDRIGTIAAAATEEARDDELATLLADRGIERGLASGTALALAHYGTTPDYLGALSELATDAVRVIAGDLEEVPPFDIAPSGEGETDIAYADLAREFDGEPAAVADSDLASSEPTTAGEPTETDESGEPDATDAEAPTETSAAETDTENVEPEGGDEETAMENTESAPETATTEPEDREEAEPADDPEPAAGEKPDPVSEESAAADSSSEPADKEPEPKAESGAGTEADSEAGENGTEAAADLEENVEGEAGMYEMDDEEREEIEDEFGAEFTTGSDVEEPGEAAIEAPEPEEREEGTEPGAGAATEEESLGDFDSGSEGFSDATDTSRSDAGGEPTSADAGPEDATETDDEAGGEDEGDVDLEAYAVETMQELDDGDGADRETVVERVASETGTDEEAVESAIDEALMSGQCYEPEDGTLKAI